MWEKAAIFICFEHQCWMQEPIVGVNPAHVLLRKYLETPVGAVKIYLTATCHNKPAPWYGYGDFGSMGTRQLYPWESRFPFPPKIKTYQQIVLSVRAMLLVLFMHWWR